ncbi:hypothetical protein TNCV_2406911 [Trichonephila clavipes]|nr:hypothetical protein TNCV_2406911 [Trichonephila clavipes]
MPSRNHVTRIPTFFHVLHQCVNFVCLRTRHLHTLHGFYDKRLGRRTLQSRVASATLTNYPHLIEHLTPAALIRAFLTEQTLTSPPLRKR